MLLVWEPLWAFEQYGQLTIHNRRDNLAAEPLGTFRPHVVGLGTTAQIQIGFTPNAGIVTAYINSVYHRNII